MAHDDKPQGVDLMAALKAALPQGVPAAWRYRLKPKSGKEPMPWKYVDRGEECNPLDAYEREPLYAALAPRSSVAANKDEPSELVKRISAYSYADADTVAKLEREAAEWKRKFYGEAVDRAPRSATAEFETWFKAEFTYGDGTAEPPHDDSFKDMLRGAWDAGAASRPAISTLASADVDVGQQPWSGSICSCGKSTLNGPVSCATKDCPMAKLGGYVPGGKIDGG